MSFVSTIIGTAERVPLPDVIVRAAFTVLAHRDASRHRQHRKRCLVCRRDGGARHRRIYRRGQRPALRGAGGVLRPCAGPEPQIFLVLLQGAGLDAAGGRGGSAAPDRRACRSRRRPIDPRTRLRLGLAVAVDGAAVSAFAGHGGVELALAARIHRRRSAQARPDESARGHRRHERVRRRRNAVRPHRLGRDVRAHDELARTDDARARHG